MNKETTFKYICKQALLRAIEDVVACIPAEIQKKYNLSYLNSLEEKQEKLYIEYNNYRKKVREMFFDTGVDGQNLIDMHKICACFTIALLKVRIFNYDRTMPTNEEDFLPIFYSNYRLAFLFGMHFIYLCMLSDYKKNKDDEAYQLLNSQGTIIFPKTNPGHDGYIQGRVKTLALNDIYGIDFDILTYADMLFWIEKYNKDAIESKKKKFEV